MREVTEVELGNLINTSTQPIIIDFWAEWCSPCKNLAPIYEQIAEEYKDKAIFCKVNTDKSQDLANQFEIQSLPTIIKIDGCKEKLRISGLRSKKDLIKKLELNE